MSSTFCSNPDAFEVDGKEKDPIFDSLNSITQLPPSPSKDGGRPEDSAAQSPSAGKVQEGILGENPPAIGEVDDLVEKPHADSAGE